MTCGQEKAKFKWATLGAQETGKEKLLGEKCLENFGSEGDLGKG